MTGTPDTQTSQRHMDKESVVLFGAGRWVPPGGRGPEGASARGAVGGSRGAVGGSFSEEGADPGKPAEEGVDATWT